MKTAILNIAPGKIVDYHGEPCLVLEHRKDGTLMLHLGGCPKLCVNLQRGVE